MRKLCPNLERDDALDTVLEVPIPEEMFSGGGGGSRGSRFGCTGVKAWMRSHAADRSGAGEPCSMSRGELQLMLGVIGAPLIPLPVSHAKQSPSSVLCEQLKGDPIESSSAKYIVQQYIAASGGEWALNRVTSMYAMGKVRMTAAELNSSDADGGNGGGVHRGGKKGGKGGKGGAGGEIGGFVLWQKKPELWCLELVVSGCKISAGSDGKVAWRQTPWHQSHASRGPPRPLRRSLQGLDPMLTASLFAEDSVCIGERSIDGEDCFVLKVEAEASSLRARNSSSVEIIRHTVWGYFSQRTGLLVQLEDSHLLQIKSGGAGGGSVFWETTMESRLRDYRAVDGVNIAHSGRTAVSLVRFGDTQDGNTRTRMEEHWDIEEVDFNIWGLSMDCFLPPSDLKDGKESQQQQELAVVKAPRPPPLRIPAVAVVRVGPSQVAAVNLDETESLLAR